MLKGVYPLVYRLIDEEGGREGLKLNEPRELQSAAKRPKKVAGVELNFSIKKTKAAAIKRRSYSCTAKTTAFLGKKVFLIFPLSFSKISSKIVVFCSSDGKKDEGGLF